MYTTNTDWNKLLVDEEETRMSINSCHMMASKEEITSAENVVKNELHEESSKKENHKQEMKKCAWENEKAYT